MPKFQPKPYFSLPAALLAAFAAAVVLAAHSAIPPDLENRLFSEDCNNGDTQTVSYIVKGQTKQYWKRGALTTKVQIIDIRAIGGRQFRMTGGIAATREALSEEFELLDQGYRTLARTLGGEEVSSDLFSLLYIGELAEAVRFELTVELPPRQFSRLQP